MEDEDPFGTSVLRDLMFQLKRAARDKNLDRVEGIADVLDFLEDEYPTARARIFQEERRRA